MAIVSLALIDAAVAQEQQVTTDALPAYMTKRQGAEDPGRIELPEAMWQFYQLVNTMEQASPGRGQANILQAAVGLDEQSAAAVLAHIKKTVDEQRQYSRSIQSAQCQAFSGSSPTLRAEDVQLAPAEIGKKFNMLNAMERRQRYARVGELFKLLEPAERKKVYGWVETNVRPTLSVVEIDYSKMLAQTGQNPRTLVERMCSPERK